LTVVLAIVCACGGERSTVRVEEVEGPYAWGSAQNVTRVRHLWFSAQVDEEGLRAAKESGVTLVIDLRAPGERGWDEAAAAERVGLDYENVVVPKDGPFPTDAFARVEALVESHPDEQVLIHCSSGNRAAGWLTTHLVRSHEMPFQAALAISRKAGLRSDEMAARAAAFLGVEPGPGVDPAPPAASTFASRRENLRVRAEQLFGTLPLEVASEKNPIKPAKVELGRMLYYDARLSKSQAISCNSCHKLDAFGVDAERTSPGHHGQRGARNSPTVYNAALHVAQFWDGRAPDVEEQAKGPILNPIEMAMPTEAEVIALLESIPGYAPLFRAAFPDDPGPISYDNIARAIGAFERRLITPSRFDDFIGGDVSALNQAELAGLEVFLDTGCPTCHTGPALGGQLYQKLGVVHPFETQDTGREGVTGKEGDRFFFKVPSLRNVAKTGPYFHDGSVPELEEAVRLMAWHQLGRELSKKNTQTIVTFLRSLTGRVEPQLIARPELPAAGPETPTPDPT
jgi:cytochrome c peroxidase